MLDLPSIHRVLHQRHFQQVNVSAPSVIQYRGDLHCNGIDIPVLLEITDKELVTLPKITLIDRPSSLPLICSHLSSDNILCYASNKITHLDIYQSAGQILDCITKAEQVLSRLLSGDPLSETRDEFPAYWGGEPLLVDLPENATQGIAWNIEFEANRKHWIISGSEDSVKSKYAHLGGRIVSEGAPAYILCSSIQPIVIPDNWPPTAIGDIASWLKSFDKDTLKSLESTLKDFSRKHQNRTLFVIQNNWAWFGFSVTFSRDYRSKHTSKNDWVHYLLWGKGKSSPITRLQPDRIDPHYLISRNLSSYNSLEKKHIVLAGCGAIGGYLAELLVRAGAGSNGGSLTLVDPDYLTPGNLGRHLLGVRDLYLNKAEAVKGWVTRNFPASRVFAFKGDIRSIPLVGADLLVDATGEEALSNALNLRYLNKQLPSILYAWIKGPGTAAQCLLVDSIKSGCFRCLRTTTGEDRYSPMRNPVESSVMGHGCDDYYVPFSASASMQSASLAGQMILDWVNGKPSPRFRTRIIGNVNIRDVKDNDLTRVAGCPACGR